MILSDSKQEVHVVQFVLLTIHPSTMATTNPPNAVPDKVAEGAPTAPEGQSPPQGDGFFALLIRSVFEVSCSSKRLGCALRMLRH